MKIRASFLFLMFVAAPGAYAQGLDDFARFSRAIGKDVSVVDRNGVVREGIVEAVTTDGVTLRVGPATHWIVRTDIASAERIKDASSDRAWRGAMWALAVALVPNQGWSSTGQYLRSVAVALIVFPTAGYLFDASESHREPLFRSGAPVPALTFSWRF